MTAFRCTAKLLKAMKAKPVAEPTRCSVVIDAVPYATVPQRFCHALSAALLDLGVDPAQAAAELATMQPFQLASSNSKSMLSSINHFTHDVQWDLRHGNASSAAELTRRLRGRFVLSPACVEFPGDRVREAFGLSPLDKKERVAAMLRPPDSTLQCTVCEPWVIPPIS